MDFKQNAKYFNPNNMPLYIAGVAFLVAVVGFILGVAIEDLNFLVFVAIALLIVAIVVLVFGGTGRMKDSELDALVEKLSRELDRDAIEKFNLYDTDIKTIAPYIVKNYEFSDAVGSNVRRGSDNKYRSSVYGANILLFAPNSLYTYHKRFSLLSNDIDEVTTNVIPYGNIKNASITSNEYSYTKGDKTFTVKSHVLVIELKDGSSITVPALFDADADNAVSNIKRLAERAAKQENA